MLRAVKAKSTDGAIVPLEPLDIDEGEELLVTLGEETNSTVEAEDTTLAWVIAEGLNRARQQTAHPRLSTEAG